MAWTRVAAVEETSDSEYIFKTKEFAYELDLGYDRSKGFKDDFKVPFNFLFVIFVGFFYQNIYYCHLFILSDLMRERAVSQNSSKLLRNFVSLFAICN